MRHFYMIAAGMNTTFSLVSLFRLNISAALQYLTIALLFLIMNELMRRD